MAGLKKGDRVRAERSGIDGRDPRGDWAEGVVIDPIGNEKPHEISIRSDSGDHRFVYRDTARLLPEPRQERVKVGDTVRVTSVVEGVVTRVHGEGDFEVEGPHYFAGRTDTEVERTVKVLKRHAYPVGTLYENRHGERAVKTGGAWIWLDNGEASTVLSDEWVRTHAHKVHEPPTS